MGHRAKLKYLRCDKNAAGWYVIRDPKTRREWRAQLYAEQHGCCALCGHAFASPDEANNSIRIEFAPTFDHIVRYADGGLSDLANAGRRATLLSLDHAVHGASGAPSLTEPTLTAVLELVEREQTFGGYGSAYASGRLSRPRARGQQKSMARRSTSGPMKE
jgi:hypothetical protein